MDLEAFMGIPQDSTESEDLSDLFRLYRSMPGLLLSVVTFFLFVDRGHPVSGRLCRRGRLIIRIVVLL